MPLACSKVHILRVVLVAQAPYAQLAIAVVAPALEGAASHVRTRVVISQGDRDG